MIKEELRLSYCLFNIDPVINATNNTITILSHAFQIITMQASFSQRGAAFMLQSFPTLVNWFSGLSDLTLCRCPSESDSLLWQCLENSQNKTNWEDKGFCPTCSEEHLISFHIAILFSRFPHEDQSEHHFECNPIPPLHQSLSQPSAVTNLPPSASVLVVWCLTSASSCANNRVQLQQAATLALCR